MKSRSIEPLILRLLSAWCMSSVVFCLIAGPFYDLNRTAQIGLIPFLFVFSAMYVMMIVLDILLKKRQSIPERKVLPISFAIYSFLTILQTDDVYFVFVLTALWAILLFYYNKRNWLRRKTPFSKKRMILWISVACGLFLGIVGATGVLRYLTYRAPNFDFGIFCQMFFNMKRYFVPVTTCERDGLLSHFAVHLSPILYVLLPVFLIFDSPVTLQLAQAALLSLAVIPLALLCRRYRLSYTRTAVFSLVLLCYPAAACGTNYDFHENCFLLPLLLWLFYCYETQRYFLTGVFTLLTLSVKEDAAVYIAFFAIFVLLNRKNFLHGALLFAGACVYFFAAIKILSSFGEGVMSARYENFIVGDGSLLQAVKNVLVNPGYAFTQILTDNKGDHAAKLFYFLQMAIPLAFMPFGVKHPSRLLLLLPMLLLNFLTLYVYQYDIGFQYSFGSTAFLFYLSVMNVSEMKPETGRLLLSIAAAAGMMMFVLLPLNRFLQYGKYYFNEAEDLEIITETLADIPSEQSVACSTFLLPRLSNRDILYETYYHKPADGERLDYIILDVRFGENEDIERYKALGYQVTKTVKNGKKELLVVLQ